MRKSAAIKQILGRKRNGAEQAKYYENAHLTRLDCMHKCFKYWTDAADGKWHSLVPGFAVKMAKQQFEGFVVRGLLLKSGVVLSETEASVN